MAPQSKKRKDPPTQSTNLHSFFQEVAASKKSKRQSLVFQKKPTPKLRRESSIPDQDVIVIDFESDNGASKTSRSRTTNVIKRENSSDIQFVQGSSKGAVRSTANHGPTAHDSDMEHEPVDEDNVSFGHPSTLLRPIGSLQPLPSESRLDKDEDPSSWSFGAPVSLLCNSTFKLQHVTEQHLKARAGPSRLSANSIQREISSSSRYKDSSVSPSPIYIGDDEWGMGDDEIALIDPEADKDEEEMVDIHSPVELAESLDPNTTVCPICELRLVGLFAPEVQEHVNKCIDSSASSTTASFLHKLRERLSPSDAPKPLLALSSIQASHSSSKGLPIKLEASESKSSGGSGNAFAVLMTSHKENEAWKEATIVEDRNFRPNKGNEGRRKAPFYKVLQGMPIAVDAFRYGTIPGVNAYFLTHAHSDHYTNLASNWKSGPIYCSEGTANLVIHMLAVDPKWVHPLPMDVASVIPDTGGVRVTCIEANHCPGSCLFLFEGPQTVNAGDSVYKSHFVGSNRIFRYLHCGDFRASPRHVLHPAVKGKSIDHVYLDTTYLDPKYTFPPQPLVISACAELARRIVAERSTTNTGGVANHQTRTIDHFVTAPDKSPESKKQGKILVVVGTYSIGKERIVKAIALALKTQVYCDSRKAAILRCQSDPDLHALLTTDPLSAGVHLVPLSVITSDKLKLYMDRYKGQYTRVIGFRPTGWTFAPPAGSEQSLSIANVISRGLSRPLFTYSDLKPSRNSTFTLTLYGVPYSEHSSFFELTCFAMSFDWGKMIATVNVGSENSRGKMARWVEKWENERKRKGKTEVVKYRNVDYW